MATIDIHGAKMQQVAASAMRPGMVYKTKERAEEIRASIIAAGVDEGEEYIVAEYYGRGFMISVFADGQHMVNL